MITRVFNALTCMPLILLKYYYKTVPEISVTLNYFTHLETRSNATNWEWQYEGIINAWAPCLGHRQVKYSAQWANRIPTYWKWKKQHTPESLTSEKTSSCSQIYQSSWLQSCEPEIRQASKNIETTVHHSPCSFQCFRKGYNKTNQLLSTRISIFPKSHRWPDKLLKHKFSPHSPSFFFF